MKSAMLLVISALALGITPSEAGTAYFFSSQGGPAWGTPDFTNAMSVVNPGYSSAYYQTSDASPFSAGTSFVFMEGSADTDSALQAYLDLYGSQIQSWVNTGGHLMINSAGWDTPITTPFGVTISMVPNDYTTASYTGDAVDPTNPVFQGPYTPVGTSWSADYFAHGIVVGPGVTPLINGTSGATSAYGTFGSGFVLFSAQSAPSFQTPVTEAENLLQNEIVFAGNGVATSAPEPGTLVLLGAGMAGLMIFRRRSLESR